MAIGSYIFHPEEIRFISAHISLLVSTFEGQGREIVLWRRQRLEKFSCACEGN